MKQTTGNITVFIRWEGFFNKIAQKFFHRSKVSSIDLDDYGSFVWNTIDDKKTFTHSPRNSMLIS